MTEKKNYPGMFDLIKGYAMIVIILEHTHYAVPLETLVGDNPSLPARLFFLFEFLLSFGYALMPLFFMLSGYGFSPTSMTKCLKKQTRTLLKPYFITAFFVVITCFVSQCIYSANIWSSLNIASRYGLSYLLGTPKAITVFGINLISLGSVWFLLALFFSWIFLNAIMCYVPERYQPLVILLFIITGYVTGNFDSIFFCLPQGFIGAGYMYIGYLIKKKGWFFNKLPAYSWCILVLLSLTTICFGEASMSDMFWKLGLIDITGAGCFAFLLARCALKLNRYNNVIFDKLRRIGRYSFWILCVHTVEFRGLLWKVYASNFFQYPFITFWVVFAMRLCLVYAMCKAVKWYNQSRIKRKQRAKQKTIQNS